MINVEELLIEAAKETEFRVRNYSGRGMYGRNCLGVVGESVGTIIADILKEATYLLGDEDDPMQAMRDLMDLCGEYRTDNMGLSMIVYWPDINFGEEDNEE